MEEEEESLVGKEGEISSEPTSWKLLDIKAMKVNELRSELEARSLNAKGLKAQLVARLQEAIQKEQEEEPCKSKEEHTEDCEDAVSSDKMDTSEITEKSLDENETKAKDDSSTEKKSEEPEVMEIDRKTKTTEKNVSNDDDIFVKPQPAMDDKQKQALTTAYKLPGMNLNCSNHRII
jgi:heterogeneous nuclear ribonucleoprotein U-like protein 1